MGTWKNNKTVVHFWIIVLLSCYVHFDSGATCPVECRCDAVSIYCMERGLTSVPRGIQEGYKTLFLHNNQINNAGFPTELHNVASVEMVHLYGNQLDEFPLNLPKNVKVLHLQENNIQTISRAALAQLLELEELHLDDNLISTVGVEEGAFREALNLKLLFLTKNHLSSVPVGLPSDLKELRLDENRISKINLRAFGNVTALQRLILDGNLLEDDGIALGSFHDLNNLRELSLARNFLSTPPPLLPSASLVKLNFQDNRIKEIPISAFVGLLKLEKLDLSGNGLQSLPQGAFDELKSLKMINVRNNLWHCNCNLKWIVEWLRSLPSFIQERGFICHQPAQVKGTAIRELILDVLECQTISNSNAQSTWLPSSSLPQQGTTNPPQRTFNTTSSSTTFSTSMPPPTSSLHIYKFPPAPYPPYNDPLRMSVFFVNASCVEVTWESYFTVTAYKVTWVKRNQNQMTDMSQERTVSGETRKIILYNLESKTVYRICVYILDNINSYRPGEDTICSEIRTKSMSRNFDNSGESGQAVQQDTPSMFLLAGVIGGSVLLLLILLLSLFCWHVHRKSRSPGSSSKWQYTRSRRKDDDYCEAGTKKDNSILEISETSFQIVPLNNEQLLKGEFRVQPIYLASVDTQYRDCHPGGTNIFNMKSSSVSSVEYCTT